MTTPLISGTGLAAMRGERILFTGVTVRAGAGEAILLRGANGAGKTTLLRILAGLTRAEAGQVARQAPFHWCGHRLGLKPHETPRRHLSAWARAWGSAAAAEAAGIDRILAEIGLRRPADVPARYLSAGQRQRTALARLLLEPRPLWLMDEPYAALDSEGQALLAGLIDRHRSAGGAVIAAIHGAAGFAASAEVGL